MAGGFEPKTKEHWHVYWVINDPEFKKEAFAANDYSRAKYWKEKGIVKRTAEHKSEDQRIVDELRKKYCISQEALDKYWAFDQMRGDFDEPLISSEVDSGSDSIVVRFRSDITRDDYVASWNDIQRHLKLHGYKTSNNRRKPPQETKLIYAIFKARQRGNTFNQIFWQYQQGNLPGYSGSSTQFISEDSLERYYRKYKPTS